MAIKRRYVTIAPSSKEKVPYDHTKSCKKVPFTTQMNAVEL